MKCARAIALSGALLATSCLLSPGQDLPSNSNDRGSDGVGVNDGDGPQAPDGDIEVGDGDAISGSGGSSSSCGPNSAGITPMGGSCSAGGAGGQVGVR